MTSSTEDAPVQPEPPLLLPAGCNKESIPKGIGNFGTDGIASVLMSFDEPVGLRSDDTPEPTVLDKDGAMVTETTAVDVNIIDVTALAEDTPEAEVTISTNDSTIVTDTNLEDTVAATVSDNLDSMVSVDAVDTITPENVPLKLNEIQNIPYEDVKRIEAEQSEQIPVTLPAPAPQDIMKEPHVTTINGLTTLMGTADDLLEDTITLGGYDIRDDIVSVKEASMCMNLRLNLIEAVNEQYHHFFRFGMEFLGHPDNHFSEIVEKSTLYFDLTYGELIEQQLPRKKAKEISERIMLAAAGHGLHMVRKDKEGQPFIEHVTVPSKMRKEAREILDTIIIRVVKNQEMMDKIATTRSRITYDTSDLVFFWPNRNTERLLVHKFAKYIHAQTNMVSTPNTMMFYYDKGVYKLDIGNVKLGKIVVDKMGDYYRKRHLLDIASAVHYMYQIDRDELYNKEDILNCLNGYYDLSDDKFLEHTPELLTGFQFNVIYNPGMKCPNITKFFIDVLPDERWRNIVLDYIAYCLVPVMDMEKALFMLGAGANGKSKLISLVQHMIGTGYCNIPIQSLENNRFAASETEGKLINAVPDLSNKDMDGTSVFKGIVGRDTIMGEKKFKDIYSFTPTCRFLVSMNQCPPVPEHDDDGYFRRLILVHFIENFKTNGKDDPQILDKLTTPDEISGFFNMLLERLQKLRANGYRIEGLPTTDETREDYSVHSFGVRTYHDECIRRSKDHVVSVEFLYTDYETWCDKKCIEAVNQRQFVKQLKKLELTPGSYYSAGLRSTIYGYTGIITKSELDAKDRGSATNPMEEVKRQHLEKWKQKEAEQAALRREFHKARNSAFTLSSQDIVSEYVHKHMEEFQQFITDKCKTTLFELPDSKLLKDINTDEDLKRVLLWNEHHPYDLRVVPDDDVDNFYEKKMGQNTS